MSIINISILLAAIIFSSLLSWNGAMRWHNKTRSANKEDPRDQEIRELTAALSIVRKEREKLNGNSNSLDTELNQLRKELETSEGSLADAQQNFTASQETLNSEIERKADLDTEIAQLRRDLDVASTQIAEMEVQVKIGTPNSGLMAGLDDLLEDDEKEIFTIRHEHKVLKAELEELQGTVVEQQTDANRWKQHCSVMTKNNKMQRSRLDELEKDVLIIDDLKAKAVKLSALEVSHRELQEKLSELAELQQANADLHSQLEIMDQLQDEHKLLQSNFSALQDDAVAAEKLQTQLDALLNIEQDNKQLELQLAALKNVESDNVQLQEKAREFAAIEEESLSLKSQVRDAENLADRNAQLQKQIAALAEIENENQTLVSDLKNMRRTSAEELQRTQSENEALLIRVEAVEEIQAENDRLIADSKQLRQSQKELDHLQAKLEKLEEIRAENEILAARITQLEPLQEANSKLEIMLGKFQKNHQDQRKANDELGSRIEKLSRDRQVSEQYKVQVEALTEENRIQAGLQVELDTSRQGLATALAEVDELKLQLADTGQLQREIDGLKDLLSEQNNAQEKAAADKALFAAQIEDTSRLRLELENTCIAAQSEVAEMTEILEEQDLETKELQDKLNALKDTQSESDELRARLQKLEKANAKITSQHEKAAMSLATEQDDSQKLREELEHLAATIQKTDKTKVAHDTVGPETKAVESTEKEPISDSTDSLPILDIDGLQDDLKTIRGVGAKIEHKLNMLGIRNFKSLVDLDDDGYERAAKLIPNLEGRMRRDGWNDQARELHLEKYNEAI